MPAPPPPTPPALPCPTQRLGYRLQNGRFRDAPMPGESVTSLLHLEIAPVWARLMHCNDTDAVMRIDAAAIAGTAGYDDEAAPLDAAGKRDSALWRRVGYSHGGGDSDPLSMQGAADVFSLDLPPRDARTGLPSVMFSDWTRVAPVARADGGVGALLLVRVFAEGMLRYSEGVGPPDPAVGRVHAGFHAPGNGAVSPWTGAPTRLDRLHACYGVQYIGAASGATVIGIGDSIIHSACTTGEVSGFGIRACTAISTPNFPVGYVNQGFPGRGTIGFCTAGIADIAALRPQIALIQTWSQNEAWTLESAENGFARALAVADAARRHGCIPVLMTAAPVFAEHPEADPHRRANVAWVRAAARDGAALLDLDAIWGTGATPNAYRPEYDCGDRAHPNDHACAVAARHLAPMLRGLLGRPG